MEDLSEKEQIDQMRAWWSEYGNYVMGGIVVGIGLMVGVGQYRSHTVTTQTEASGLYEQIVEAVVDGNLDEAETAAEDLFASYDSTIYPSQARLALARLYMDKGRDEDAASALRSIVDKTPDTELGQVARLRLAKVLIYQNDAAAVIDMLSDQPDSAFSARYSETLGDAHLMLGNIEDARNAYLVAMADNASRPTVDRTLVQMKLDDLPAASSGGQPAVEESAAAAETSEDESGDSTQ